METPELVPGVQLGGRRRDGHQAAISHCNIWRESLLLSLEEEGQKIKTVKLGTEASFWEDINEEKKEGDELESSISERLKNVFYKILTTLTFGTMLKILGYKQDGFSLNTIGICSHTDSYYL